MVERRLLAARPNPCSRHAKQRFLIGVHRHDGPDRRVMTSSLASPMRLNVEKLIALLRA